VRTVFIERLLRGLAPTLMPTFSMFSPSGTDYSFRYIAGNFAECVLLLLLLLSLDLKDIARSFSPY